MSLKRSDGFPVRPLVTALAILWTMAIGLAAASGRTPAPQTNGPVVHATPPPAPATPAPQATGLVGDATCATCHDGEEKALHQTLHGKAQNARTPAAKNGQACETCHGPGQKHVDSGKKEDILRFNAMSARDVNATCLSCHTKSAHTNWQGGMHDARNLSCATCHSVHRAQSERAQLKTATVV